MNLATLTSEIKRCEKLQKEYLKGSYSVNLPNAIRYAIKNAYNATSPTEVRDAIKELKRFTESGYKKPANKWGQKR